MINPLKFHPFSFFLIACLALAGLMALPSANPAAIPVVGNFEIETDQIEFEDDFLAGGLAAFTLFNLTVSKTWLQSLDFRNIHPVPAFPPPKFS